MQLKKVHPRVKSSGVWLISMCLWLLSAGAVVADVRFTNPTVGGYALDLCRDWAANCGKPAADAYCVKRGYPKAVSFQFRNDSPTTRVINGGQVCNQPFCDRITSVTCSAGQTIDPGTILIPADE